VLSIQNLSFYFGSRPLYENISLHIKPKDHIGLIGLNGTGKSTLLRLIVGEYTPDSGSISKAKDCTIGFLNQDLLSYQSEESILHVAMQAFEEQNQIHDQIEKILHQLETDYSDKLVNQLTDLQSRFEALGGYTIQSQAEEILEGLGFSTQDLQRPLQQFSGGWRMRVMLAKMLLQKPALLLLDEPTNHLDLPSILWLENYLKGYEGAYIIATHDRQFLQNTINIVIEVAGNQLHYYSGDYEYFLEEKALRQEIQKSAYENQQQYIKQTERFIERFRAKATKAKQVQSRVKALNRLDVLEDIVDTNAKVHFKFNFGQNSGRVVSELKKVKKSFGDLTILQNTQATIERGDKIALVGANGKGKSTLLRIIAGTEPIDGESVLGYNVRPAFYAQHQLESLQLDNNLLHELQQTGTAKTETELRTILGCFLFGGEDVFKKIKVLSGGEKSRVALAKVLLSEANFLLLDEPTNHLDMQSVNILIQALQQYQGTYLVVSHDRHFVSHVANKIWYIEDYQIKEYPGTYDEYEYWRSQNPSKPTPIHTPKTEVKESKIHSNQNSNQADRDKELKNLNKKLQEVELEIIQFEKLQKEKEEALTNPDVYQNAKLLAEVQETYNYYKTQLSALQTTWDELAIEIDQLQTHK
jgi:ATP-binding cassette, subfamily F, member 3